MRILDTAMDSTTLYNVTFEAPVGEDPDYNYYLTIGESLEDFRDVYTPIHGWISIFVCLFGIIANILNIIVLTR